MSGKEIDPAFIGRYQIAGAGDNIEVAFYVLDTITGEIYRVRLEDAKRYSELEMDRRSEKDGQK